MSGRTPSWAKPQNAVADPPEAGLHLVGEAEGAGGARARVGGAEVAGRNGEDPVAREDVVADSSAGSWPRPRSRAKASSTSPATRAAASGDAERGGAADSRHPRLERLRAELLGRQRGRCGRRAVVGVLGDDGAAVARDGAGDLDRDVVRLAPRVDEHHDGELVGKQCREAVGIDRHVVDEVARVRREPLRLTRECRRHAWVGVTDLRHVVVGVEQAIAVDVGEPDAVARIEAYGSS